MEIEIQSQRNNALLNRTEVRFIIYHERESTPRRELVRTELAEKLHTKKDNVFVDNMKTKFGISKTFGYAKVYSSMEKAKAGERKHIIKRNISGGGEGKDKGKTKEQPKEVSKEDAKEKSKEEATPSEESKKEQPTEAPAEEKSEETKEETQPETPAEGKPEESKEDTQSEKPTNEKPEDKKEGT